jgi:hypothetical protein
MNYQKYKENFENNINNKKKYIINEKEETIFDFYMLLIGYIIIITFGVWFHNYFYKFIPYEIFRLSIAFIIIIPLILYSYYIFYQIFSIRQHKSYEELLEETKYEIKKEEKISEIIPVILFGIGIIYANIQKITKKKKLLKIVAPFLIFSLIFGTVITNMISYLILDHYDLHTILISSDIDFVAISISFGLMLTSLLMPFITLYN